MVELSQLAKIPFLSHENLPGRVLFSTLFFDGEWHAWIEAGGQVLPTRMWPAESIYFGTKPERETDILLHFMNLMGQQLNYLPIAKLFFGLQDDVFNISASLTKIRLLHRTRNEHKTGTSRLVASEVEYLHGVCRSIFDLWQGVIVVLWDSITLVDTSVKKKQLKKSYREMVFESNKLRTVKEMVERFPGLPPPLADCYVRSGRFFADLRKFRDGIIHQGAGVQVIFDGQDDFMISENRVPFREMNIWNEKEKQPNGLVPLTPALGLVIYRTLEICDYFSETIGSVFKLPPPIVPNFVILLRGYFNEELARVVTDIQQRLVPEPQT